MTATAAPPTPSLCPLVTTDREGILYCGTCKRTCESADPPEKTRRACRGCCNQVSRDPPGERETASGMDTSPPLHPPAGPGTELFTILRRLNIHPPPNCTCEALRRDMDAAGAAGCRARREEFLDRFRANAAQFGWNALLAAATSAALAALKLRINPLHPLASLYDRAVSAAEHSAPNNTDLAQRPSDTL